MSEHVMELNDEIFDSAVSDGITLVDFWAPWCQPCRMQGPIIERVAEKLDDDANIAKAKVDQNPGHCDEYGIQGIPTLLVFRDGQPVDRLVGLQQEEDLMDAVESAREASTERT
mgnify:CR=1 FL=1